MGKHDEIVLQLTNEKLIELLKRFFGERGVWSRFNWVIDEKIEDWNLKNNKDLLEIYGIKDYTTNNPYNEKTLKAIKKEITKDREKITNFNLIDSFEIKKTFEYPLIKGEKQYKCTKGFLDLIIHLKPICIGEFCCYGEKDAIEFIIEIKKEDDFNDFGSILRQIKEYRTYYEDSCEMWCSDIIGSYGRHKRIYCILAPNIPKDIKKLFEEEEIQCLELSELEGGEE